MDPISALGRRPENTPDEKFPIEKIPMSAGGEKRGGGPSGCIRSSEANILEVASVPPLPATSPATSPCHQPGHLSAHRVLDSGKEERLDAARK
jgi:hypothetical protein